MTYRKHMLTVYGRQALERDALQAEQLHLAVEAAGIAGETSVRADYAVARQHDRNRVAVHRAADRARGARLADLRRQCAVGRHLAERHERELAQHLTVEVRHGGEVGLEVEVAARPGEVLVELTAD